MTRDLNLISSLCRFDDIKKGDNFTTGSVRVSAALIDQFAEVSNDRFGIHMDVEAARRHGFEDRVAHGLLILSLVDGLKNTAPRRFDALASLSWDWSFMVPVLAGDTIRVDITI